jgi:WD40 repeat protein
VVLSELKTGTLAALKQARRQPGRRTTTPYLGLARFEEEDALRFFGREDVTGRLADLAAQESSEPLVLIGPSGAGKSSLLRAGLLPLLTADGPVVFIEPGATPLNDLEAGLAGLDGARRPTVIVDQLEAIFTQCEDETSRREFIAATCELATRALVIMALRADFYDQAIRYPGLASALQARPVVLGAMSAEQVRCAVTEPARLASVHVEDALVKLLLADLAPKDGHGTVEACEAGALPLLSHAMLATWNRSHGGTLTVADYVASGGIRDALTHTADSAYKSLSPPQRRLAQRLFLRLVHVADDLPPSRLIAERSELRDTTGADAWKVLDAFVDKRLISVDADTVQITHDSLLTAWPRLRSWIDADLDGLRIRRRITEAARAWRDAGRENAALLGGSRLAFAREWAADEDNRASLPALAAEFVDASCAEAATREHAERRRTRRLKGVVAVLGALVVVVCLLAAYAFQQRQVATAASDNANSREIAVEADQTRDLNEPLAAQLSVAGYDLARTPQATASLLESTDSPSAARILDSSGIVQSVAVTRDHRLLAATGADGTLRLWNITEPGHPLLVSDVLPADSNAPLYAAAFSPDGKILAVAGAGRVVRLWNVSDPARPVPLGELTGPVNTIYSVAFSPDGQVLAAASADDTIRLWNVANPARARPLGAPLTGLTGFAETVAFSPDGTVLAAGSSDSAPGRADDSVWLWNVTDPAHPVSFPGMPLSGPAGPVSAVAFSPAGTMLAASSQDHSVWLWKLAGKAVPDGTLTGATNWVNTVAFSPDGTALAAGTSDASVLVWNLARRSLTATLPESQPVTTVTWDGADRLAASDADGTVSLWTLPTPVLLTGNAPTAIAYSPDGALLAVGGQDVQLWAAASRELSETMTLPAGTIVNGLAYSPDGALIAIARSDGTTQLLDARTLAPVSAPFRVTTTGNAETVAFSPDGRVLATGADDGTVRLWSVTDPSHPRLLSSVHDSGTYVYTVAFAPDGTTLAAASVDDLTRLWNVANPVSPVLLGKPLGGLASYAIGLAFSPDGTLLAIGSADETVRLWNVSDPARPTRVGAPLTGPAGYVWAVAFSPDGKTLAAGVTDGSVWLWNVADPANPSLIAALTGPDGHVYSVAFTPSGTQLAASSDDGTVHIWDTSPAAAQAAVCSDLGQPLTSREWATYMPGLGYRTPCTGP